jgi:hypothetical protein
MRPADGAAWRLRTRRTSSTRAAAGPGSIAPTAVAADKQGRDLVRTALSTVRRKVLAEACLALRAEGGAACRRRERGAQRNRAPWRARGRRTLAEPGGPYPPHTARPRPWRSGPATFAVSPLP